MPLGAGSRALREHFWFYFRGIQCPPQKHLEIPSFDTTVRRRPDRSRPPQVGAAAHTCTESADRTAPAEHTTPRSRCLSELPPSPTASGIIFPFTLSCRTGEAGRQNQGGAGGIISDLAVLPKDAQARLLKTHFTSCTACTTAAALNAGSEFRLLAAVGRAPDVARGPRASRNGLPAALPPSPTASSIIFPFTLSCRTGEAGRQKQGGAGGIISPACLSCLSCLSSLPAFPAFTGRR